MMAASWGIGILSPRLVYFVAPTCSTLEKTRKIRRLCEAFDCHFLGFEILSGNCAIWYFASSLSTGARSKPPMDKYRQRK